MNMPGDMVRGRPMEQVQPESTAPVSEVGLVFRAAFGLAMVFLALGGTISAVLKLQFPLTAGIVVGALGAFAGAILARRFVNRVKE
jgi:hypothetical protein